MPIRKIEENGETRYEGLQHLEDVGWADYLVVARGTDRDAVIRELTQRHLFEAEKLKRQCTLLRAAVSGLLAEGTNADVEIEEAIGRLVSEVCEKASQLADYHPLAGQSLEVAYDDKNYKWTGADGTDIETAISDHRIDQLRYLHGKPKPEQPTDTPAPAKALDQAIKLVRKARKLNERARARKATAKPSKRRAA